MKKEKKIGVTDLQQPSKIVETRSEAPIKKPRKAVVKKKVEKPEVVAKASPKKQAKKVQRRKPGPKKAATAKVKKVPERKPRKKAPALVPAVIGKKPAAKKLGLIGRKTDLLKMGEGAFLFAIKQQEQIEEMKEVLANYERIFEAVRQLFSREIEEIEELVTELLE